MVIGISKDFIYKIDDSETRCTIKISIIIECTLSFINTILGRLHDAQGEFLWFACWPSCNPPCQHFRDHIFLICSECLSWRYLWQVRNWVMLPYIMKLYNWFGRLYGNIAWFLIGYFTSECWKLKFFICIWEVCSQDHSHCC